MPRKYAAARDLPKPARDETSRDYARTRATTGWTRVCCVSVEAVRIPGKARLRDPTKAKMRRRVFGKGGQTRRAAQQVKCLIVAPNVSDGEELQRQITEILDGAAAAKIPCIRAREKETRQALRKQSCSY